MLRAKADRQVSTLSGGEQKMLEIGRAMLLQPRLLLIDEPSVGLSPILVRQVFGLMQQLRDRGTTVLMIEQNAKSALAMSDYGIVLQQGRVALAGTAAEVLDHPEIGPLFLGGPSAASVRRRRGQCTTLGAGDQAGWTLARTSSRALGRDVLGDDRVADVAQQDEAELAALALLVAMHRLDEGVDGHRHGQRRLPDRHRPTSDSTRSARPADAEADPLGQPSGGDESDADGLAVVQRTTTDLLEGVGERVPEIEHGPPRLFERIVLDDGDLDLDRLGDERLQAADGVALLVAETVPLAALELGEQVATRRSGRA